jgi:hypothetical protein
MAMGLEQLDEQKSKVHSFYLLGIMPKNSDTAAFLRL